MSDRKTGDGATEKSERSSGTKRPHESELWNNCSVKKLRVDSHEDVPQSVPSVETAMSNDLVLDCVFKHLSTPDLIRCRPVNGQWNRASTKILKKRPNASVRVNRGKDLEALEDCIANSADFPFREIDLLISHKDFGGAPEKWLELGLFRQRARLFTRLRLTSIGSRDILIGRLLAGPFKRIVSLTLNHIRQDHSEREVFLQRGNVLNLKKLKTLNFGRAGCDSVDPIFLGALLRSCPNLQRIINCTNTHSLYLRKPGKLGIVRSLRVCTCVNKRSEYPAPSGVELLIIADGRTEAECGPYSRTMSLPALRPLLNSNRETLRRIEVYTEVNRHRYKSALLDKFARACDNWPRLSNLTSLKLMKPFDFPENVNEIFPALKTIELGAYPGDDRCLKTFTDFMWTQALPSVTTLEVFRPSSVLSSEAWIRMSEAVPNVHNVFLGYENRQSALDYMRQRGGGDDFSFVDHKEDQVVVPWHGLSHFKHLETLHISPIELPRANLDQILTGIPDSQVEEFKANPKLAVMEENTRNGIALLSGLKELVIGFTMPADVTQEDFQAQCPITSFALDYGLNRVPNDLKIRFLYDLWSPNAHLIEEALSPVSDRVGFGQWNNTSQGYLSTADCVTGLVTCQRTEHPRLIPRQPWVDNCTRQVKQLARRSRAGIPRHPLWRVDDSDSD